MKAYLAGLFIVSSCLGSLRHDVNGDGIVNFVDFASFASEWMVEEMANKALQFDGTGYIDTGVTFQSTFRDSFAVNGWCQLSDGQSGASQVLFGVNTLGSSYFVRVFVSATGILTSQIKSSALSTTAEDAASFSNGQNNWKMVTAVFTKLGSASKLDLYVNSILVKEGAVDGAAVMEVYTSTKKPFIGGNNNNGVLNLSCVGIFDQWTIYNAANLPDVDDLNELWNGGQGRKYAALSSGKTAVAAWNMDEGSGVITADALGGSDASLTGGVAWVDGGVPFVIGDQVFTTNQGQSWGW